MQAEFGVIGGTGLYDPKLLKNIEEVTVETPYGKPSDTINPGRNSGANALRSAKTRQKHTIRPTDINVRANIFALKKLGVKRILHHQPWVPYEKNTTQAKSLSSTNSSIEPQRREQSFYTEGKLPHYPVAEPMCPELRKTIISIAKDMGVKMHENRNIRLHRRTTVF